MNHFLKENNKSVYTQKAVRIMACVQSQLSRKSRSLSDGEATRQLLLSGVMLVATHSQWTLVKSPHGGTERHHKTSKGESGLGLGSLIQGTQPAPEKENEPDQLGSGAWFLIFRRPLRLPRSLDAPGEKTAPEQIMAWGLDFGSF